MTISSEDQTTPKRSMTSKQRGWKGNSIPTLRDPIGGWKHFAALLYVIFADLYGLLLLLGRKSFLHTFIGILLSAHGRIIASYLVHDAAHASIFKDPWANTLLGIVCVSLSGCPYADFYFIREVHLAHHKDRLDVFDYDFRDFYMHNSVLLAFVKAMEWFYIPAVESLVYMRTAVYPLVARECELSRRVAAWVGTPVTIGFYIHLWLNGTLLPQLVSGALVLHFLSYHDAFQHTYELVMMKDYTPGPGNRNARYEDKNTFSNPISLRFPWLNILALNFVYHNAHHKKPMVPWYALPKLHQKLYGDSDMSQTIPFHDLIYSWHVNRLRRVVEEEYGVVHPPDLLVGVILGSALETTAFRALIVEPFLNCTPVTRPPSVKRETVEPSCFRTARTSSLRTIYFTELF